MKFYLTRLLKSSILYLSTSCCFAENVMNTNNSMGPKNFSVVYRGFLISQDSNGKWSVPMLPNWSNGPVSQGPYSTRKIAEHVIDTVLNKQ